MFERVLGFVVLSITTKYTLSFFQNMRTHRIRGGSTLKAIAQQGIRDLSTKSVADFRKEYSQQGLVETDSSVKGGPFNLFKVWLTDAIESKVIEPNAMCLSTCSNNKPSARYVLLKGYDERGFVWYTNYQSRKSQDLLENPYAAVTFWWGDLERSVRIEGRVEKVSNEESDRYFQSRPRGSQIGAWSSNQSHEIDDRNALEKQEAEVIKKFEFVEIVPRPPHWGGFRLVPNRIEFWKGRQSRLHDRIVFQRDSESSSSWSQKRLQP